MTLSPSAFMRQLRPECYSDTTNRSRYALDRATLEYHLDTITNRNQTHDFEIFCRKLCERVVCPNLRPQTGPEGGGDGKADSETYPVADEVSSLTYIGEPNSGSERWAFAFSAKKRWAEKACSDVKGLVSTNRAYDRILCVTSQFAPSKKRAEIEDSLREKHGIPVIIHDRSWIVTQVIEHDHGDLAFDYLHVGTEVRATHRLGPADYSRSNLLEDIEKAISDPLAFEGMATQRVTETLLAAKLSRGLERPRPETEGRFARAMRLADRDGTHRQKLEARYEALWTGFWWYDDVAQLNASYDQFEAMLRDDEHVKNIEFLTNLAQLLVSSVLHGHLCLEESKVVDRLERLKARLNIIKNNNDLPNASLEAETALLFTDVNLALLCKEEDKLPALWPCFSDILERAKPMGEFDAERLVKLIEVAGNLVSSDAAYDVLVENLVAFVSERCSEVAGARILVKRAEQLSFDQHFEIIRLLGKATNRLYKKEHVDELIEALSLLVLAYRSAGLLWAARATLLVTAATIFVEFEETSKIRPIIFPVMKTWGWSSLQLRHIPDFLNVMEFLAIGGSNLPLTDESRQKVAGDFRKLDLAFASNLLNCSDLEVRALENTPQKLEDLGMFFSRCALLYTLGHEDQLREDGSLPSDETDEGAREFFSRLARQPVSEDISGPLILNASNGQSFETRVLGLTLIVNTTGSTSSILAAEAVLGAMEALLATAIELDVVPHTEIFSLDLNEKKGISEPELRVDLDKMRALLEWPMGKIPADYDSSRTIFRSLTQIAGTLLAATCYVPDMQKLLTQLFEDELVTDRITTVLVSSNSYSRVLGCRVSRMPDGGKRFPLRQRPTLVVEGIEQSEQQPLDEKRDGSHRAMGVRSIIDIHLWDRVGWRGVAYFSYGPQTPPILALMFENRDAAEKIFKRWRARFGAIDKDETIYLAIIRRISAASPADYRVLITSSLASGEMKRSRLMTFTGRHMTMTPATSDNLDRFLDMQAKTNNYLLVPAICSGEQVEPLTGLYILKSRLIVRNAADVGPNDIEAMALSDRRTTKLGER